MFVPGPLLLGRVGKIMLRAREELLGTARNTLVCAALIAVSSEKARPWFQS